MGIPDNLTCLLRNLYGLPCSSDGESACNGGDLGSIPQWGRSTGDRNGNPTPVFLPGEFHGLNRGAWQAVTVHGVAESDTTERLTTLLQEAIVRTRRGTMGWFQIGKGVSQDCKLSPFLFNLYAE